MTALRSYFKKQARKLHLSLSCDRTPSGTIEERKFAGQKMKESFDVQIDILTRKMYLLFSISLDPQKAFEAGLLKRFLDDGAIEFRSHPDLDNPPSQPLASAGLSRWFALALLHGFSHA